MTSIVGHFDGHASALEQYRQHCPMQHIQGSLGSHWIQSSVGYSLHIALAAARATANKTAMKKCTNFAGYFDGHIGAPVGYRMHCPMEEVQGFERSHWTPPLGKY